MPRKREGRSSQRPPAQNTFSRNPSVATDDGRQRKPLVWDELPRGDELQVPKDRRALNRRLVALHATGRPADRYTANRFVGAYRERVNPEQEPWHDDGLTPEERETAELFGLLVASSSSMLHWTNRGGSRVTNTRSSDHASVVYSEESPAGEADAADTYEPRTLYFGPEAATVRGFLREGGWHAEDGSTGVQRGRPRAGLAGDPLLAALPFPPNELLRAIRSRGHRTPEQNLMLDVLRVFCAARRPNAKALADAIGCGERSINRYQDEGAEMLESGRGREAVRDIFRDVVREEIAASNERQLTELLVALGIDPVAEAEAVARIAAA